MLDDKIKEPDLLAKLGCTELSPNARKEKSHITEMETLWTIAELICKQCPKNCIRSFMIDEINVKKN